MEWLLGRLFGRTGQSEKQAKEEQPASGAGVETENQLWRVTPTETETSSGDVVFVHGLDGNLRTTWQAGANGDLFFPRMLGKDLPSTAIWSVGYDVSSLAWRGHTMPLVDRAINILALLEANDFGSRPIVFITHSLGGLLVKQMLRHAVSYGNQAWLQIAEQTKGVAFLSTPHAGSELASWLQYMHLLLPTVSIQELEAQQPNLRDLNLWYRSAVAGGSLRVENLVLYEKRLTHGLLVVNPTSADPGIPGVIPIPIDADHINICKPDSTSGTVYKLIRRFAAKLVGSGSVVVPIQPPATSVSAGAGGRFGQESTAVRSASPVQIVFETQPEYPLLNLSVVNLTPDPLQITAVRVVKAASVKDHHDTVDYLVGPRLRLNFELTGSKSGQWVRAFGGQQISQLQGHEAEAFQLTLECENNLNVVDLEVEYVAVGASGCAFPESVAIVHAPFADHSAGGLIAVVRRASALNAVLESTEGAIFSQKPYRDCAALNPALIRSAGCLCRDHPSSGWRRLKERFEGKETFGIVVTSFAELGARVFLPDEIKEELEVWAREPAKLGSIPVWDTEAMSSVFLDAVMRLR